jgi:deoxyribodipyrimidine photo-lyase
MSTALVWFRRDLRLHDNPALSQAVAAHARVIPVYIHAPQEEAPWVPGGASRWWLHHSLAALDTALRQRHSQLLLRQGDSLAVLRALIRETGATAVYWNRLYEPQLIARDKTIKAALREEGLEVQSDNAALLFKPWTLCKDDGNPYQVFTPFWKACTRLSPPPPPLPAPVALKAPPFWPESLPLAALRLLPRILWYQGMAETWQPGEEAALDQLAHFCTYLLDSYPQTRDLPGVDGVSRLSPRLHFGEISPRQIWIAVSNQIQGDPLQHKASATYLRELGWREFAHYVLYHWPHTAEQPMQERFAAYPWRQDYDELLSAWQQGRTGIPLVDAGMRELWHTGWMHNRARLVTASWLTKNCRIPWQEGARWFWDTLVDADLANNTLGWQWTAGCGTDAAPYFRIFNPVRQGERFDPDGTYVRRWLPELAAVPTPCLHQPWTLPAAQRPLFDYPQPLVDLDASRAEALQGYERIRNR